MAMEVNGAALFQAVATDPSAFGLGHSQVNILALALLCGRLKDKAVGLDQIRSIAKAIGASDFKLALDSIAAKDLAAISKRVDPKHPDLRGATEAWNREHIWTLADGAIEPTLGASKLPPKPKAPTTKVAGSKTGEVMKSKALKSLPVASKTSAAASKTRVTIPKKS